MKLHAPTLHIQFECSLAFALILYVAYGPGYGLVWPLPLLFALQCVVMIRAFTPVHEGVHGLLAEPRWLNELLFTLLWPLFPFGPHLFRMTHLIHHAHVRQPGVDPDMFAHGSGAGTTAIRCLAIPFYCLFYLTKHAFRPSLPIHRAVIRGRTLHVVLLIGYVFGQFYLVGAMLASKFAWSFALTWLGPSLVSLALLTYLNAVCPHARARAASPFDSTRVVVMPRWIEWLLCDQNYHFVHHYRPRLPWYAYREFWREHGARLVTRGVRVVRLGKSGESD